MTGNPAPGFAKRPDYALSIAPAEGQMLATIDGETIADSANAIAMTEQNHDPVIYFPRADVRMDRLERTAHETFCPFKGHASYWSIGNLENAAWSYEAPFDEMLGIRDCIAFYADKVTVTRV